MRFDLSEDQLLVQTSLDRLADRFGTAPNHEGAYVRYSEELRHELADSGFLDIARFEDRTMLDAALVVERVARLPFAAEVAASALLGPALDFELSGPLALCEAIGRPTRYLPQARHVCLLTDDGIAFANLDEGDVRPLGSVVAYPVGVLDRQPAKAADLPGEAADRLRTLWRLALAVEAAGLMRGALDLTTSYVKDRRQFGQALGSFQAIQHRLAVDEQLVSACFVLAMRAADSLDPADIATAALYAQHHMRTIIYDCHQFTGALGVTLEYPLHLWTYRLKFIQGELGGQAHQAEDLAARLWPTEGHGQAAG